MPSGGNEEDDHAQAGHSAAERCRVRTIRPAGARYHRHEFLPRRSGADGFAAHPSAGDAVPSHRAASRPPWRARRRPSRRLRAPRRPAHARAAPARQVRPRRAVDRIPPGLSRTGEGRVRRVRHPRAVDPQGHHGLAGQISCRGKARLHLPVQPDRIRHGLPDQRHRRLRKTAGEFRQRGAEGKISRWSHPDRHEQADARRPVHDREGGRLRRRHADHARRAGGRPLAPHWRKMVLLERGCQGGDAAGASRRRRPRHARRRPVPDAALPRGRRAEPLPDRASEGQARHALDGVRGDQARRRDRLRRRQARPRLRADGRDGEFVAALQRRQIHRADAPRPITTP
ncbi:hypothetical protein ABIE89_002392 [Bradyrhizobium niftali]